MKTKKRIAYFEIADQNRLKYEYPTMEKTNEGCNKFLQKDHIIFNYQDEPVYIAIHIITKKEYEKQKKVEK